MLVRHRPVYFTILFKFILLSTFHISCTGKGYFFFTRWNRNGKKFTLSCLLVLTVNPLTFFSVCHLRSFYSAVTHLKDHFVLVQFLLQAAISSFATDLPDLPSFPCASVQATYSWNCRRKKKCRLAWLLQKSITKERVSSLKGKILIANK